MGEGPQRSFHVDEPIVVEPDDWVDSLREEPFRSSCLATLRGFSLRRLQRLPPPRRGRLPFGHELRVLASYLGDRNAVFDPSAFSRAYRALASARDRELYSAFVLSESLGRESWARLIGEESLARWLDHRLLRELDGGLRCRFVALPVGRLVLLGDALRPMLKRRVLIGQDSANMVAFLERQQVGRLDRYLDVGPGSGVILLALCDRAREAVGLDINPRAVEISRLNAELNGLTNCTVHLEDALAHSDRHGRFDLVTWNSPFVFLPEDCKDTHYDAYGGHLGMEKVLRLVERLPDLLTEGGRAYVAAVAPIPGSGENLLEMELSKLAPRISVDVVYHALQAWWHDQYRDFHESHGIRRFEVGYLEVVRGRGAIRRLPPPPLTRLTDAVRGLGVRILK